MLTLAIAALLATLSCGGRSALAQLTEARRLSADLLVQFTAAGDAANKAVMADTDEASVAFAREAVQRKQAIQTDADALRALLEGLNYSDEAAMLQQFVARFAEYNELDRRILTLAVENTNVKAQRLSFGPAQEAADAFRDALTAAVPVTAGTDGWRAKALIAEAIAVVREAQALQAPHIAAADDAAMGRLEERMTAAQTAAADAVTALAPLVPAASRARLTAAAAALERFKAVNAQIVELSRRNTNVKSLALSLNEKGQLTSACQEKLRDLRDALAKRGFSGTR